MDVFAPYAKINGCFIVQNISPQVKTIRIFNYPIPYQQTRDLLAIPGVSEPNIRASLLKGELLHKILARDIIIICSDIDLLQFNQGQHGFLQTAGIDQGLQSDPALFTVLAKDDVYLVGSINYINTTFTLPYPDIFFIQNSLYKIKVYLNGVKLALNDDFYVLESGGPGTGFDTIIMNVPPRHGDALTADYYINN